MKWEELWDNPELAVEMVKKGKISREEAETWMTGVHLCEFRAWLCDKNARNWDCLDCKEHGFETCDIECSMPCEKCIRFRLCKEEGVIAKCEKCGEWYIKSLGCDCEF